MDQSPDCKLDKYGRPYPSSKHHHPTLTCDALVFRQPEGKGKQILLITRGHPPFLGRLAFPGGHLDYNEDPRDCVLRELKEETCLTGELKELITVKGDPLRDTRGHYVTIAYRVEVAPDAEPKAADDAATANWYDLEEALNKGKDEYAFDHYDILKEAVNGK